MGQRIQIIFKTPEIYWNEGNCNNQPKQLIVYHNQWLFGRGFLNYTKRLITAMKYIIKDHKETIHIVKNPPIDYRRLIEQSIGHANYSDLSYLTWSMLYSGGDEFKYKKYDATNILKKSKSVLDFLSWYDNNNGYLFIEITKTGQINYSILSGLEDTDEIKNTTPKDYLRLFYSDDCIQDPKKLDAVSRIELFESIDFLDNEVRVDALNVLDKFKKSLSKKKRD